MKREILYIVPVLFLLLCVSRTVHAGEKGDINGDSNVDALDIKPFVDILSGFAPFQDECDIAGVDYPELIIPDGVCDSIDIAGFVNIITGQSLSASTGSVPEPSSLALFGIAWLSIFRHRRRKA